MGIRETASNGRRVTQRILVSQLVLMAALALHCVPHSELYGTAFQRLTTVSWPVVTSIAVAHSRACRQTYVYFTAILLFFC